ncbi:hypothetical protein MTO96_010799 [Rhipicephalus appendiculatus]
MRAMASFVFINAKRSSPGGIIRRCRHSLLRARDTRAGYGPILPARLYACRMGVLGPSAVRRRRLEITGTTSPRTRLGTTGCIKESFGSFPHFYDAFSRAVNERAAPFNVPPNRPLHSEICRPWTLLQVCAPRYLHIDPYCAKTRRATRLTQRSSAASGKTPTDQASVVEVNTAFSSAPFASLRFSADISLSESPFLQRFTRRVGSRIRVPYCSWIRRLGPMCS